MRLQPEAFVQAHPLRRVNNRYSYLFELESPNDHLDGVGERSKLRLRWYGEGFSVVQGVLELKHRSNRVGWKSYCPMPPTFDLTTISWNELMGQLREHATGEHAMALARVERPTLLNSYVREYYESMDEQIRLTIDSEQRVYEQLTHTTPNVRFPARATNGIVVEVKADPSLARRISNLYSSLPVLVEQNSKYVDGILNSTRFTNRRIR